MQDKISRVHIDQQTEFKALVSLVLGWGHDPRSLWTPEGDQILSIARPVYMYQIKSSNWLLVLDIEEVRKVGERHSGWGPKPSLGVTLGVRNGTIRFSDMAFLLLLNDKLCSVF